VFIDDLGSHDEAKADEVAIIIMETTSRVADIVPQLALRFHKDQNLIVRLGGLSKRFVNLPPETHFEVLSRTLN